MAILFHTSLIATLLISLGHRPLTRVVEFMQDLHRQIADNLHASYEKYKLDSDAHRRELNFSVGDLVLAHFIRERFPPDIYLKLQPKKFGPFKIVKRYGPYAYLLDLPPEVGTSPIFNIAHLFPYHGTPSSDIPLTPLTNPSNPLPTTPLDPVSGTVDQVLDAQEVVTRSGAYQRYLVTWYGRDITDSLH